MKHFTITLATFLISLLLVACGGNTTKQEPVKQETPKALKDDEIDLKSYSRSAANLTDELYQELVDKTPALKKLEEDLETLAPKPGKLNNTFDNYDSKSNNYYSSTNYLASQISDSVLKTKIISLIAASSKKYEGKTAELKSLLNQISKNTTTLNDHRSVLKIILTLAVVEKYQDANIPNKKEFKDLVNEQNNLLQRTDSLTPKY
jgi:hypothetical protein